MTAGAQRTGAFFRALAQMRENTWLTLLGVTSLSVALAIAGAYLNLFLGLVDAGGRLFTGTAFLIVMSDKASEPQALELAGQVARYPGVARSSFVGKRQGLMRFREQLGPQAGLLDGLEENPLPDLVEVLMEPGLPPPPRLTEYLNSLAEVDQVVTSRPWLERLEQAARAGSQLALFLGILLVLGVILLVMNTVRLSVHVRRRELEVMDLLGATSSYMRAPFLLESVMIGLLSAGLASLMLWLVFSLLQTPSELARDLLLEQVLYLRPVVPLALAVLAVFAGLLGGLMGVGRALGFKDGS